MFGRVTNLSRARPERRIHLVRCALGLRRILRSDPFFQLMPIVNVCGQFIEDQRGFVSADVHCFGTALETFDGRDDFAAYRKNFKKGLRIIIERNVNVILLGDERSQIPAGLIIMIVHERHVR
jgi:hypothetical protein